MKIKIGFMALMLSGSLFALAQQKTSHAGGAGIGLRAGINFQNINGKDESGNKLENDLLTGFNAGIIAEFPAAPDFYFQTGLLYSIKGAKGTDVIFGQSFNSEIKISYVELPLNFIYKPMLGKGRMLLGFGPYVALGVGGKATYDGGGSKISENIQFQNKVKVTDPDDVFYLRPLDAGANMLVGYEFSNRVSFQLNTQLGLLKINPEYETQPGDKTIAKNTGFGFSLGFRF